MTLFEFALIGLILLLLLYYNKKKLRKIIIKNKIPSCCIEKVDQSFEPIEKDNLKKPKKNSIVNFFCIPESFNVVGMTSDYEAWILSVLSKKCKNIFEFGTCSGKTTLLFAMNSPDDAKIESITLDENLARNLATNQIDNKVAKRNIVNESKYKKFMFSDTEYENKINIIFKDSSLLDVSSKQKKYDLIFIDGGHTYTCIKNDTEKSLEMIKENGLILWHDFSIGKTSHKDVFKYLNEISKKYPIKHIENTSLCYLRK